MHRQRRQRRHQGVRAGRKHADPVDLEHALRGPPPLVHIGPSTDLSYGLSPSNQARLEAKYMPKS